LEQKFFADQYLRAFDQKPFSTLRSRSGVEINPEPMRHCRCPLFVWKGAWDLAAAIIVGAREDEVDSIALGMSFDGAYFKASGEAHYEIYDNYKHRAILM